MATDVPDSVSGVDDQELAAVVGLLPELPNIGAEPADRFAQAVRTLVEKRAQKEWPNEGGEDLAVFVMVDHPRRIGEKHGAVPFADPIAKDDPLLGRLFFANRDASSGRFVTLPEDPNGMLEWLDDKGLGNCPIVTVYRKSMKMVTRRAGTSHSARTDPIRENEPTASMPELMEALQHYHRTRLLTPICCPDGVWTPGRARQYVPGPQPEKCIQSDLEVALNFWFRGVVIAQHEDSTNIGRIDVRLLKKSNEEGSLTYWVIMELKVIKSFTNAQDGSNPSSVSASTNVGAIVKGVEQAGAYRKNRGADEGLLEIYDLRKNKTADLTRTAEVCRAIRDLSAQITVHVWPVFGTAEDARASGYSGV